MTSTAKPDYWSLLGLHPGANSDELKRAFRREARRWHPDLNGNDVDAEERFKLINEAYAVLNDPRKRAIWEGGYTAESLGSEDPFSNGFPDFNEYINVVFKGKNINESYENREVDLAYGNKYVDREVDLAYENKYVNKEDLYSENNSDRPIKGWPTKSSSSPPPIKAFEDIESLIELTPEEALSGTTVELELDDGTLVELKTPPFAGDGWRLRLEGIAYGGKDHFVQLRVETEEGLRIDGLRVLYRLELLPADAVLGCAVEVPTLLGPVTLQVPPGSSTGRLLRLRGRGLEFDSTTGDQLVEISVYVPSELTDAERALYQRLQELANDPDFIR